MTSTSTFQTYSLPTIQWLTLLALGFSLSRTLGSYGFEFVLFVLIAMGLFTVSCLKEKAASISIEFFLKGTALFFLGRLCASTSLYSPDPSRIIVIRVLLTLAFINTVTYLFVRRLLLLKFTFLLLSLSLLIVPFISPDPKIDVFVVSKEAIQHLLSRVNPYTVEYSDTYSTAYNYRPGYGWWPGALVTSTVASLVLDFRWAFALALILSAAVVYKLALTFSYSKEEAWFFSLLSLAFPVTPLVVEQAWVDPFLIVSAAFLAWGLKKRNGWIIGTALGYHLSIKQYALITLAVTAMWLWRSQSLKFTLKVLALAFTVFSAFTMPFFLDSPKEFLRMGFTDIMGQAPRNDSFTLYALLSDKFQFGLPDYWTVIAIVGTLLVFFKRWMKKIPSFEEWSLCVFLTTCLGFLLARRAFCNYFHFSSFFLVLYLVSAYGEKNARTS